MNNIIYIILITKDREYWIREILNKSDLVPMVMNMGEEDMCNVPKRTHDLVLQRILRTQKKILHKKKRIISSNSVRISIDSIVGISKKNNEKQHAKVIHQYAGKRYKIYTVDMFRQLSRLHNYVLKFICMYIYARCSRSILHYLART